MGALSVVLFPLRCIFKLALIVVQLLCLVWFLHAAYDIRMYSARDFGMLIHEFDPWFNYRAAEYLAEHGLAKFFKWYDYMSWYPIGRPIGTTIYPGMQMTAVFIWETMKRVPSFTYKVPKSLPVFWLRRLVLYLRKFGVLSLPYVPKKLAYEPMSVNDICCMIPPWFGSIASLFTGLLAYEVTRSVNVAVMATGVMAVIPAHLMRSVAGEFDNEAVAMAAICCTFWLWLRSVRSPRSWPYGILTGISYVYMVAAWGGYIFVVNMIGIHAAMLVGLGRFNSGVHKAYTLFFVIGTYGAMQIPVVGWQPLRSLEQLGPLLVFLGYQVLAFCDFMRRRRKMGTRQFILYRVRIVLYFLVALAGVGVLLYPTGYFGPLSARIRGLFVKHTKTGNPLVDSVAEHQPASAGIYMTYLNLPLDYAWHGAAVCLLNRSNGCYFTALYGFIATHFSGKMSRLVLICGPICAVACAIWCGFLLDLMLEPFLLLLGKQGYKAPEGLGEAPANGSEGKKAKKGEGEKADAKAKGAADSGKSKKGSKAKEASEQLPKLGLAEWEEEERPGGAAHAKRAAKAWAYGMLPLPLRQAYHGGRVFLDRNPLVLLVRAALSVCFALYVLKATDVVPKTTTFVRHCHDTAKRLANPKVVYFAHDRVKGTVKVDDYLKGYQWIDANTPKDARVIAWWDYGYQITGIAKRTSIADGNTWNHEHIATLGRTLTSPEKRAWNAIRHLADYVLVWAGGGGDDLAKSPHLARIGNSVFPDHCGDDDPKCNKFSFYADHSPTPMMARSLLYKLVMHKQAPGVKVNENLFKEVHSTKHGLMRVYQVMNISQESKDWVADPKNRICDAPGSWYCVGQYPPALEKLIAKRRNFAQLEDFNKGGGSKSAYTKLIEKERGGGGGGGDL